MTGTSTIKYRLRNAIAAVTPSFQTEWAIHYGHTFKDSGHPVKGVTIKSSVFNNPVLLDGEIETYKVIARRRSTRLGPDNTLRIEIILDGGDDLYMNQANMNLAELLSSPLDGYVEFRADHNGVRVRAFKHVFGHAIRPANGQRQRNVKLLKERNYYWEPLPK